MYHRLNPPQKGGFFYLKKCQLKELWDYDKDKIDLIIKNGYNLEVVWESQLKENPKLIKQIIKKYDTRE